MHLRHVDEWFHLDISCYEFHECEDADGSLGDLTRIVAVCDSTNEGLWLPAYRPPLRWTDLAGDEDMEAGSFVGASRDTSDGAIEKTAQVAGYAEELAQGGFSQLLFDALSTGQVNPDASIQQFHAWIADGDSPARTPEARDLPRFPEATRGRARSERTGLNRAQQGRPGLLDPCRYCFSTGTS